jgi:hypothetical protein
MRKACSCSTGISPAPGGPGRRDACTTNQGQLRAAGALYSRKCLLGSLKRLGHKFFASGTRSDASSAKIMNYGHLRQINGKFSTDCGCRPYCPRWRDITAIPSRPLGSARTVTHRLAKLSHSERIPSATQRIRHRFTHIVQRGLAQQGENSPFRLTFKKKLFLEKNCTRGILPPAGPTYGGHGQLPTMPGILGHISLRCRCRASCTGRSLMSARRFRASQQPGCFLRNGPTTLLRLRMPSDRGSDIIFRATPRMAEKRQVLAVMPFSTRRRLGIIL